MTIQATSDQIGNNGKWHVETYSNYFLIDMDRLEYTSSPKVNLANHTVGQFDGIYCAKDAPMLLSAGDRTIRTSAVTQIAQLER